MSSAVFRSILSLPPHKTCSHQYLDCINKHQRSYISFRSGLTTYSRYSGCAWPWPWSPAVTKLSRVSWGVKLPRLCHALSRSLATGQVQGVDPRHSVFNEPGKFFLKRFNNMIGIENIWVIIIYKSIRGINTYINHGRVIINWKVHINLILA